MAFLAAMSVLELVFIGVFILALGVGTALDRNQQAAPKWWVLSVALLCYFVYNWWGKDNAAIFTLEWWKSSDTWIGITKYLVIGLVYSLIECVVEIVSSERDIRKEWTKLLSNNDKLDAYQSLSSYEIGDKKLHSSERRQVYEFCNLYTNDKRLVNLHAKGYTEDDVRVSPKPKVNRAALLDNVLAWTLLWPGYAVSLGLGRALDTCIEFLTDLGHKLSTGLVKVVFNKTFKSLKEK